jgi:hypothetical protein
MLRSRSRVPAVAVAFALSTMLFATCPAATELPGKAKACCAAMQDDCSGASMEPICCAISSTTSPALVPARPADTRGLSGVIAVTLPHTAEPVFSPSHVVHASHVSPSPPGVPTYLFVSSFRI